VPLPALSNNKGMALGAILGQAGQIIDIFPAAKTVSPSQPTRGPPNAALSVLLSYGMFSFSYYNVRSNNMSIYFRNDAIPGPDEKFAFWLKNLLEKITPAMGVREERLAILRTKLEEFLGMIGSTSDMQNTMRHAVQLKRVTRQELEKSVRTDLKMIKASPEYTLAEGLRLGIETPLKSSYTVDTVPQLTAVDRTGGIAEVGFSKYGSDGVNIYGQRQGDNGWVLLGFASRTPFVDNRPLVVPNQAEMRRYSAVYVKKRQEVGGFSDEVVVACTP